MIPLLVTSPQYFYDWVLTSDALNFVVNTVHSNTVLCLLRNLMRQTLASFIEVSVLIILYDKATVPKDCQARQEAKHLKFIMK